MPEEKNGLELIRRDTNLAQAESVNLTQIQFTEAHSLSPEDVATQLSNVFGVSTERVKEILPRVFQSASDKYRFSRPPEVIESSNGGVVLIISGTGNDPLPTTFLIGKRNELNGQSLYELDPDMRASIIEDFNKK